MEDLLIWVMLLVVFILLPLFFLWAGVSIIRKTLKFNKGAVRVQGTIVSVREQYTAGEADMSKAYTYYPTYEYVGPNGEKFQGETASGASNWNYPIGRQDEVMVNSNDPTAVRYPGHSHFIMGGVLLAFAAVFFGFGVFMFLSTSGS